MKQTYQFINQHKEAEPLTTKPTHPALVDEYMAHDAERANTTICKSKQFHY